jgi:hypothetical protein
MTSTLTHKYVAATLAFVFAVFNIGIPVVIASCPMPKIGNSPMCFACNDDEAGSALRLKTYQNTSCCATVIAAGKNDQAFLASKDLAKKAGAVDLCTVLPVRLVNSFSQAFIGILASSTAEPSPPDDLPILLSTLII